MYSQRHNKTVASDLNTWENWLENRNVFKDEHISLPSSAEQLSNIILPNTSKINPKMTLEDSSHLRELGQVISNENMVHPR